VIADRVFAGFQGRTGHQKDPGLVWSDKVQEFRVVLEPLSSLLVPVRDFQAETVWFVRVGFFLRFVIHEDLRNIECGVVVRLVGLGVGLDLLEDSAGLHAPAARVDEVLVDLVEVLLWCPQLPGADGST
jgi:hypothetical protein